MTVAQGKLAVIVPAWNAKDTLDACLTAIQASDRKPDEVFVFNDGSSDSTGDIAGRYSGVVVQHNDGLSLGPAVGRNRCSLETDADILVFIDADVEVHPDAIGALEAEILSSPDVSAAFGAYDDAPRCTNIAARYVNLRHHYVHTHSQAEASTFWSGLGAIRSDIYRSLGGFDYRYDEPSIEDVELGMRLKNRGLRVRLNAAAQGKHWKNWTLKQLWQTDIFKRALPWSRLIVSGQTGGNDLNVSSKEKVTSVLAHGVWISAIASLFFSAIWAVFAITLTAYLACNAGLLSLFARRGGLPLLLGGAVLHWLYHVYASAVLGLVMVKYFFMPKDRSEPPRVPSTKTK